MFPDFFSEPALPHRILFITNSFLGELKDLKPHPIDLVDEKLVAVATLLPGNFLQGRRGCKL